MGSWCDNQQWNTSQPHWDIQESRGRASRERRNERRAKDPQISSRSHWWEQGWIPESVWRKCWEENEDGWHWIGLPPVPETTPGSQRWRANKELEVRLSSHMHELQKKRQELHQGWDELAKQREELTRAITATAAAASSSYSWQFQSVEPYPHCEALVEEVQQPENQLPEKPKSKEIAPPPQKKVVYIQGPIATSFLPSGPLRIQADNPPWTKKKQIGGPLPEKPVEKPSIRKLWTEMTSDSSESESALASLSNPQDN